MGFNPVISAQFSSFISNSHHRQQVAGVTILIAIDGAKGFQDFWAFHPDIVFTDVVMPELSSIELIRKIRRTVPRFKVIYTSGFGD